jgi:hypothetical protein
VIEGSTGIGDDWGHGDLRGDHRTSGSTRSIPWVRRERGDPRNQI